MKDKQITTINDCVAGYRSAIMGVATIMVMLVHQYAVHSSEVLGFFSRTGHWGVDIFLFVSGFGITHSLLKNTPRTFYVNRIKKMLPICLVIGLFGLVMSIVHHEVVLVNIVPKLVCFDNWYVYTITIYYIFSPLIVRDMQNNLWRIPVVVMVLSCVFNVFSLGQPFTESTHFMVNKLPWAVDRFFIYTLGIFFYLKTPKHLLGWAMGGAMVFILMVLHQYRVLTIPCSYQFLAFSIPCVCLAIGSVCKYSERLTRLLSFFGKHSLSIFLVHLIVYSFVENHSAMIPVNGFRLLVELLLSVFIAVSIDKAIDIVMGKLVVSSKTKS